MIFFFKFIHFQISYIIRNLNYISQLPRIFHLFSHIFLKQEYYYVYELKEREIAKRQNRV